MGIDFFKIPSNISGGQSVSEEVQCTNMPTETSLDEFPHRLAISLRPDALQALVFSNDLGPHCNAVFL